MIVITASQAKARLFQDTALSIGFIVIATAFAIALALPGLADAVEFRTLPDWRVWVGVTGAVGGYAGRWYVQRRRAGFWSTVDDIADDPT